MDKKELLRISKSIDCSYELGIWSEINSFLEYEEDKIIENNLLFNEEKVLYNLRIVLKENVKNKADEMFEKFVRFIEYSKFAFYVKEECSKEIKYYLLSSTEDNKGFLIEVTFDI